jgi:hypothetical protein
MTHAPDYPADCAQPADHGPSFYLTLPCRTFAQAVRDVSKVRDLDDWVWEELHRRRHTAEVVSLANYRRAK